MIENGSNFGRISTIWGTKISGINSNNNDRSFGSSAKYHPWSNTVSNKIDIENNDENE